MIDDATVQEAQEQAEHSPRSLRTVRRLAKNDVYIVEDLNTRKRRNVFAKNVHLYGLDVAYELAPDMK